MIEEDDDEEDEDEAQCKCIEATVLIVDDNIFNIIPLELILREICGLHCDKAMNGEEAVNMYRQKLIKPSDSSVCEKCGCKNNTLNTAVGKSPSYRLILMDLNMPVMDGFEATRQILSSYNEWKLINQDNQYRMHLVAVTAFVNEESVKTCYQVGISDVIHKPVNVNHLKDKLTKYYYCQNT